MKKLLLLFFFVQCFTFVYAQSEKPVQYATTAIPNKDAKFLLFPTRNIHIFLKLNTRTGEVYMVQYSLDGKEGEVKIHSFQYPLVSKEEQSNGRFYLYPTTNIFNFILMDQIDGRIWQVQWDFEEKNRMLTRIFSDTKHWAKSDSILLKDLEYQDLIYYKDCERFTGTAFLDNDCTVSQEFFDGRDMFKGVYSCHHKSGSFAFVFSKDDLSNLSEIHSFKDENGVEISMDEFKERYPELLLKVKKIMGVDDKSPKTQGKTSSPVKGSNK